MMKRLTKSKLFVDTGDPDEARAAQKMLKDTGYDGLDGATTNPSYFAKNPEVQARISKGDKFSSSELMKAYKETVRELLEIIPGGDISIEGYADMNTTTEEMVELAWELNSWIPTARIKLPIIEAGLEAAEQLKDRVNLNMTLCFNQEQAAAVHAATRGARKSVVVSPFIGRLDDAGRNGVQHVDNLIKMLRAGDSQVRVLAASFRRVENILEMIRIESDILTINLDRFKLWKEQGFRLPKEDFKYEFDGEDIVYQEISLDKNWQEYNIQDDLTDVGLQRFIDDWRALLR